VRSNCPFPGPLGGQLVRNDHGFESVEATVCQSFRVLEKRHSEIKVATAAGGETHSRFYSTRPRMEGFRPTCVIRGFVLVPSDLLRSVGRRYQHPRDLLTTTRPEPDQEAGFVRPHL
jgi:hypothetical protein